MWQRSFLTKKKTAFAVAVFTAKKANTQTKSFAKSVVFAIKKTAAAALSTIY